MEHISKSANRVLDYIAKKRVGRTLETLELAGCDDKIKSVVKKQFWEFKNEVESRLFLGECEDDRK